LSGKRHGAIQISGNFRGAGVASPRCDELYAINRALIEYCVSIASREGKTLKVEQEAQA
jgi:hypothetical protein